MAIILHVMAMASVVERRCRAAIAANNAVDGSPIDVVDAGVIIGAVHGCGGT